MAAIGKPAAGGDWPELADSGAGGNRLLPEADLVIEKLPRRCEKLHAVLLDYDAVRRPPITNSDRARSGATRQHVEALVATSNTFVR